MNNSFSLQQLQKTSNLDANLISRQYKLNLMAHFMRMRYENPILKQSEIANRLGYSSSTSQFYRNNVDMISPYRINPNNSNKRTKKAKHTNVDENTSPYNDQKKSQMTSNDLKRPQSTSKTKSKNVLRGGSMQDNIEINEQYLDKILDINDS